MRKGIYLGILCLSMACSPKDEQIDKRGQNEALKAQDSDAQGVESEKAEDTKAVILDGSLISNLEGWQEVDRSSLEEGLWDSVVAVHKVSESKTIFFTNNQRSWLLDEQDSGLKLLRNEILLPDSSVVYTLEGNNFWLVGEKTLAFRSEASEPGQVVLTNLEPELMKDSEFQIDYVSEKFVILSSARRVNIVERQGDEARYLNFDLPSDLSSVDSAGLASGENRFWFLSAGKFLLLEKDADDGQWRWIVSELDLKLSDTQGLKLSWWPDTLDASNLSLSGLSLARQATALLAQQSFSLTQQESTQVAALRNDFDTNIKSSVTQLCVPCHAGYDSFEQAYSAAASYKARIEDMSMPPAGQTPLEEPARGALIEWLDRAIATGAP